MKEISISILNVENIPEFLTKLDLAREKMKNIKEELFNIAIHFDVMDNKFVPNTGIDIEKIKEVSNFDYYMDTHLMVEKPIEDGYIDKAIEYGCRDITIHYEIENFEKALDYLLTKKNELNGNLKLGVSIKPATSVNVLDKYIKLIDKVLVMSVEPGFGGQKYLDSATEKIKVLKEKYDIFVQVDGGVNDETLRHPLNSNVDSLVCGSYITKHDDEIQDRLTLLNVIKAIEETEKTADLSFESRVLQILPGSYGDGDILLGIRVPLLRKLSKVWYNITSVNTLNYLIKSEVHEYRELAIFMFVLKSKKMTLEEVDAFIWENLKYINNWDLTDALAPHTIGKKIIDMKDKEAYTYLRKYTQSDDLWTKRIGIVLTLYLAREKRKELMFKVLDDVFYEEYHLYQKATGWCLRELYKTCPEDVLKYLQDKNTTQKIPSILRSYACEKMSKEEKETLK